MTATLAECGQDLIEEGFNACEIDVDLISITSRAAVRSPSIVFYAPRPHLVFSSFILEPLLHPQTTSARSVRSPQWPCRGPPLL